MDISKYADNGLTGLVNLGNTCFLNSAMQAISNTYELNHLLDNESLYSYVNKNSSAILLKEWNDLRKLMWSKNCTISPKGFLSTVQKVASDKNQDLFTGYEQNDLSEFLTFLLGSFHDGLKREVDIVLKGEIRNFKDKIAVKCLESYKRLQEKEYSEIIELFYGIQANLIYKKDVEYKDLDEKSILSVASESFFIVNLPIPPKKRNINIYDCFDTFTEVETLDGDNMWYNEKTNKKQAINKKTCFWKLPKILIIDIKRYDINNLKKHNNIDIPHIIELSKYVIGYKSGDNTYELYGVCNHGGVTQGGHYTANIKNANGKWYNYNDAYVREINPDLVITPKAYCLFFRKKISQ
jgi:ubiquitin carboxyl-terminal hydrolase 8